MLVATIPITLAILFMSNKLSVYLSVDGKFFGSRCNIAFVLFFNNNCCCYLIEQFLY